MPYLLLSWLIKEAALAQELFLSWMLERLFQMLCEFAEGNAEGLAVVIEFDHINAPLAGLTLTDVGLRFTQARGNFFLT